MERWESIWRKAARRRAAALKTARTPSAIHLAAAGLDLASLRVDTFTRGRGGFDRETRARLEPASMMVFVSDELSPREAAEAKAHELGHFHLHFDKLLEDDAAADDPPAGAVELRRVDGYSPKQVKEQQAQFFADEFLCPSQQLRDRLQQGATPEQVADEIEAPVELVRRQVVTALLRTSDPPPVPGALPALDPEQQACVDWEGGAMLVLGGSGTGKTTAFKARLAASCRDMSPALTLALVATERAAEAARAFLDAEAARDPANDRKARASTEAWIGTVAGLALEIVVRWPIRAGYKTAVTSVDRTTALEILDEVMTSVLGSRQDPKHVRSMIKSVDALRTRAVCERPARQIHVRRRGATSRGDGRDAQLDIEVAEAFEDALRRRSAVDGGGVVPAAVLALRGDERLRGYLQARFPTILVDDLQDVTPAEWDLLRELTPDGERLWATGNAAQAVGRFRGADGGPLADLAGRSGVARMTLRREHRFGPGPRALLRRLNGERAGLERAASASVSLTVVDDEAAEAAAIAARIRRLEAADIPLRDQVLLCPSHSVLNRLSDELRRHGIPLASPGDIPARSDVRAWLSLVKFAKDDDPVGFADAVDLPPYQIPAPDAAAVKRWARQRKVELQAALLRLADIPNVTRHVARSLAAFARDVERLRDEPVFPTLLEFMTRTGGTLPTLLRKADGAAFAPDLVALHHLLATSEEHDASGSRRGCKLEERVERIGSLLQDTHFHRVFPAGVNAVAVSTIHAARGREFTAVHFAGANAPRDGGGEASLRVALSCARSEIHVTRSEKSAQLRTVALKALTPLFAAGRRP